MSAHRCATYAHPTLTALVGRAGASISSLPQVRRICGWPDLGHAARVGVRQPSAMPDHGEVAMQLSARNQLQAKVTDVRLGTIMAEITATIGDQENVSAITRASAESLSLQQGDDVIIVIKATEVLVAKA